MTDSWAQFYRVLLMVVLDGTRPSEALEWVSPVAPAVTQAAVGAGHWAAGRRRRALAAWASAAGFGWWRGAWAPKRRPGPGWKVSGCRRTQTPTAGQLSRHAPLYGLAFEVMGVVLGVRWGLRNPRRLTVLAIAGEARNAVFFVLRVPRAVQRRRPRMVAGSALVVAGSVARLRAASAEPLR